MWGRRSTKIYQDIEEQDGEEIANLNFEDKIKLALSADDFRLAIRYRYLQLLSRLDELHKIIPS